MWKKTAEEKEVNWVQAWPGVFSHGPGIKTINKFVSTGGALQPEGPEACARLEKKHKQVFMVFD